MTRRQLSIIGVLVALGAVGWFVTRPREAAPVARNAPAQPLAPERASLPDLALTAYDGQTVRLQDLRGTPLVVNSWAAWCLFCVKELPDFAAVQEEFGNRVRIVAVNRAESLDTAKGFTDKLGVTEELLWVLDPDDTFYTSIGGFSMPETLFVDAAGAVVFHKRGVMAREEVRQRVIELLNTER